MIRPLAAVLVLATLRATLPTTASASTNGGYPASVLRLRGGFASPDPDQGSGPGWSAGGSVGYALNRNVLLSLSYDHLDLNKPQNVTIRRAVDPVTIEIELGRPMEHRPAIRLAAGAGLYFHRDVFITYYTNPYYSWSQPSHALNNQFGMHFGGGLSVPLWSRTLMDVDFRYHQTVGNEDPLVIRAASAGLRFLFGGRPPDPEGYVESSRRSCAYASR